MKDGKLGLGVQAEELKRAIAEEDKKRMRERMWNNGDNVGYCGYKACMYKNFMIVLLLKNIRHLSFSFIRKGICHEEKFCYLFQQRIIFFTNVIFDILSLLFQLLFFDKL